MLSRTGWPSEIFGANAEEVWALVVVRAARSGIEARKRRNGRKGCILTGGEKGQGK